MHETKRNIYIHLLKSKSDLPTVEFEFSHNALKELIEILEEPNIPKGEWINNHTTCSKCGWQMIDDVVQSPNMVWFNFCPNCGVDMREDAEEPKKCDTCLHEKEPWFNSCADCSDYELWEGKQCQR